MKKFIVVAIILICGCLYVIIKLSMSESQNANGAAETDQSTKSINAGHTDEATPSEETQSPKQMSADNTDKATPKGGSGSTVPADQVEAVTKVFNEFRNAIMGEDYEKAWKLTSESLKSEGTFEEFKKDMADEESAQILTATLHPESAISIEGRVGLLITIPKAKLYLFFIQEDGQWKLHGGQPAENVHNSKK